MVVDCRDAEQAGDWRPVLVDTPVAQNQELVPVLDGLRSLSAEIIHRSSEPVRTFSHPEQHPQGLALEVRVGNFTNLLQIGVRQDRLLDPNPSAGLRRLGHHVRLGADTGDQRHDEFFADRINRRIGHLGEQLLEIFEQKLRSLGEHSNRSIGAHRGNRFFAGHHHRCDDHLEFFHRVGESLLPLADRGMVRLRDVQWLRQFVQ